MEDSGFWRSRRVRYPKIGWILYILQKPNLIIVYYSMKIFHRSQRSFAISLLLFCSPKITQPRPQVFSVNGSIICSGLHFWRHFGVFNRTKLLTSSVQTMQKLICKAQIWSRAAGYGELYVWFWTIRHGEIFWMNNNNCNGCPCIDTQAVAIKCY